MGTDRAHLGINAVVMGCGFALVVFLSGLPQASAGGFFFPDSGTRAMGRSGAFAAKADDPTAIYYNPAGLTALVRPTLLVNLNITDVHYRFDRAQVDRPRASGDPLRIPADGSAFAGVENAGAPFPAPFLAYGHPLGDFALGAGVYGPSAYTGRRFPADGPQRYSLISADFLFVFGTLSLAWTGFDGLISIGASAQAMSVPQFRFSTASDGHRDGLIFESTYVQSEDPRWDNNITLDLTGGLIPTGILGVLVRPTPWLEIGASYRPSFPVEAEGDLQIEYSKYFLYDPEGTAVEYEDYDRGREAQCAALPAEERHVCSRNPVLEDGGARVSLSFPGVYRLGLRYIDRVGDKERFDFEIDVVHETWSVLDRIDVDLQGTLEYNMIIDSAHRQRLALADISLPHRWKDTWSLRVGSDYHLGPAVTVRAGASMETATFDSHAVDLMADGFARTSVSLGGSWHMTSDWELSGGLAYIHHEPFATDGDLVRAILPLSKCEAPYTDESSCPFPGEPTGNAVGAGRYENRIITGSLGLRTTF